MGSYNAAVDMVDRNVARRARRQDGIHRFHAHAELRRTGRALRAGRADAGAARAAARRPRRDDHARHGRFPGAVLGRDPRRHRSDPAQHAAAGRAVPLHPGGLRAKALFVSAPFLKAAETAMAGLPLKTLVVAGRARRDGKPSFAKLLAGREPARRPNLRRRGRVLALFVRLDRHAEGRAACAFEPDGDGEALRPGRARHQRERRVLLGRQALSRLRARQRHELSDVGRRRRPCCCPTARRPAAIFDVLKRAAADDCSSARRRSTP